MNNEEPKAHNVKTVIPWKSLLIINLLVLFLLVFLFKIIPSPFEMVDKTLEKFNKYFGTKAQFDATFGPIVSEQRFRRLQFYQRNQVALFRIIRYRGHDYQNHDYAEFYKMESEKRKLENFPILLNQYCEWHAKGTFEFNFYIDMTDLAKWQHKWDEATFTLTLYPPDIEANTPAELEPVVFEKKADSLTLDEDYTKEQLLKQIYRLKNGLANDQKKLMYNEARLAIIEHYRGFFRMVPDLVMEKLPEVKVIFPHEIKNGNTGK